MYHVKPVPVPRRSTMDGTRVDPPSFVLANTAAVGVLYII